VQAASTSGVELLDLDTDDKVAAAVVIAPDVSKSEPPRQERYCSNGNLWSSLGQPTLWLEQKIMVNQETCPNDV